MGGAAQRTASTHPLQVNKTEVAGVKSVHRAHGYASKKVKALAEIDLEYTRVEKGHRVEADYRSYCHAPAL